MDTTPSHTPEPPVELLDRYLAGEMSPAERVELEARIAQAAKMSAQLANPAAYVTPDVTAPMSVDEGWDRLRARVSATQRTAQRATSALHKSPARSSNRRAWYGITAGLAAALVLVVAGLSLSDRKSAQPSGTQTARSFSTQPGQQATVQLADGTVATLGPATTLDVVTSPTGDQTTVTLSGQAQFTVAHTSRAAFVVRTDYALTRVLGTTFLVRQYAADRSASVVVVNGRVAVQRVRDSVPVGPRAVLDGKMRGVVTDSGDVVVTPNVALQRYTGWLTGDLAFSETPVREVIADLARAYGVELRVVDTTLARQPITWTVQTKRYPIADALSELTMMLNAHVQVSGAHMILVPGRRASQRVVPPHSSSSLESQYGK